MARLSAFVTILLVPCLLASAVEVKSDYNHKTDFSAYHTYSWGKVRAMSPSYVDRIKDEVKRDLHKKGMQLVPSGGDLVIFANSNVHNEKELKTFYDGLGGGWGGWTGDGFGESTIASGSHAVSMLIVDVFDARSKQLIWRGTATEDLSSSSDRNIKALNENIDRILGDFPPKH